MHDRLGESSSNTASYAQQGPNYESSAARSPRTFDEDRDMNEAMEQSKRAYEEEERRRKNREETEFQSALVASQKQIPVASNHSQRSEEPE
jgi:hypothetical protein